MLSVDAADEVSDEMFHFVAKDALVIFSDQSFEDQEEVAVVKQSKGVVEHQF